MTRSQECLLILTLSLKETQSHNFKYFVQTQIYEMVYQTKWWFTWREHVCHYRYNVFLFYFPWFNLDVFIQHWAGWKDGWTSASNILPASQLYNQNKIFNGNGQVWDYLVLTSVCTHWPNRINYREICFLPFCFFSTQVVLQVVRGLKVKTRTPRTPPFWGYPPPPIDLFNHL